LKSVLISIAVTRATIPLSPHLVAAQQEFPPWSGKGGAPEQKQSEAIAAERQMPHTLPGKVGLVGFSLGGGYVLAHSTAGSDAVTVVSVWYPVTTTTKEVPEWRRCKPRSTGRNIVAP
jgi:hypothetical protein